MFLNFLFAAKNRGIAIPSDLDLQVHSMLGKSQMVKKHTQIWQAARQQKRESIACVSRDYRSIIEGLQVGINRETDNVGV